MILHKHDFVGVGCKWLLVSTFLFSWRCFYFFENGPKLGFGLKMNRTSDLEHVSVGFFIIKNPYNKQISGKVLIEFHL